MRGMLQGIYGNNWTAQKLPFLATSGNPKLPILATSGNQKKWQLQAA